MDAKHEKVLRALQKLPGNRNCFVCNSVGCQYIVPQFGIFVCTDCSGKHMACGQRVKSISMGKFTPEEIKTLEEGGNEVVSKRYLATWKKEGDAQRPLDKNPRKVESWIRAVLVEKRYFLDLQVDPPTLPTTSDSQARSVHIPVKPLSDVLGASSLSMKLQVSPRGEAPEQPAPAPAPEPAPAPPPEKPPAPVIDAFDPFGLDQVPPAPAAPLNNTEFDPFGDSMTAFPPTEAEDPFASFTVPLTAAPVPAAQPPIIAPPALTTTIPATPFNHPPPIAAPSQPPAAPQVSQLAVAPAAPVAELSGGGFSSLWPPTPAAPAPAAPPVAPSPQLEAPAAPAPAQPSTVTTTGTAQPVADAPATAAESAEAPVDESATAPATASRAAQPVASPDAPPNTPDAATAAAVAASLSDVAAAAAAAAAAAEQASADTAVPSTSMRSEASDWGAFEGAGSVASPTPAPPAQDSQTAPAAEPAPDGFDPFGEDSAFPGGGADNTPDATAAPDASQAAPPVPAPGPAAAPAPPTMTAPVPPPAPAAAPGLGVREELPSDLFCEPSYGSNMMPPGYGYTPAGYAPAPPVPVPVAPMMGAPGMPPGPAYGMPPAPGAYQHQPAPYGAHPAAAMPYPQPGAAPMQPAAFQGAPYMPEVAQPAVHEQAYAPYQHHPGFNPAPPQAFPPPGPAGYAAGPAMGMPPGQFGGVDASGFGTFVSGPPPAPAPGAFNTMVPEMQQALPSAAAAAGGNPFA